MNALLNQIPATQSDIIGVIAFYIVQNTAAGAKETTSDFSKGNASTVSITITDSSITPAFKAVKFPSTSWSLAILQVSTTLTIGNTTHFYAYETFAVPKKTVTVSLFDWYPTWYRDAHTAANSGNSGMVSLHFLSEYSSNNFDIYMPHADKAFGKSIQCYFEVYGFMYS